MSDDGSLKSALAQLAGYYLLGVPFALVLAFYVYRASSVGVFFLWGGVALAMLAAAAVQLIALCRIHSLRIGEPKSLTSVGQSEPEHTITKVHPSDQLQAELKP